MRIIRTCIWAVAFSAVAATATGGYAVKSSSEPAGAGAQDAIMLDRRISALEQRFYMLESSISRLQQQAIGSSHSAPLPTRRDPEIDQLRGQVELLNARVRELECGLLRMDERTLSATAKEARRRAGAQPKEPCRLDPDAPVRLSARP